MLVDARIKNETMVLDKFADADNVKQVVAVHVRLNACDEKFLATH